MLLIDDDTLLEIWRFLMRHQVERLELVCAHWHKLSTSCTRSMPRRPFYRFEINSIDNKWHPFFSITPYNSTILNAAVSAEENKTMRQPQQIVDFLIEHQQKELTEQQQNPLCFLYNPLKAILETNRPFWCRLCGQAIHPYDEHGDSPDWREKAAAKFAPVPGWNRDIDTEMFEFWQKTMDGHFEKQIQMEHSEIHAAMLSNADFVEQIGKLSIRFAVDMYTAIQPYHEESFLPIRKSTRYIFICAFDNKNISMFDNLFQLLSNSFIEFLRIEIGTMSVWHHFVEQLLLTTNCASQSTTTMNTAKENNFLIKRLSIALAIDDKKEDKTHWATDATQLAAFFASVADKFAPQFLYTYIPMEGMQQQQNEMLLGGLTESDIFPDKCCHLDLQPFQQTTFDVEPSNPTMMRLKSLIFQPYQHRWMCDELPENWLEMYRMSYGVVNAKGEQQMYLARSHEWAISSLSLFQCWPTVEFVEECLNHFLSLSSTWHLRGRWIRFGKLVESSVDYRSFNTFDQFVAHNAAFHRKLLAMPQLSCVKAGEFLAENVRTRDKICFLFTEHRHDEWMGSPEKHVLCPFKGAFVFEFVYSLGF